MKAVLFSRVSSKEQETGHSISAQTDRLRDYAARKGLTVIKVFELIESSTVGDRQKFYEMLNFALSQGEKVAIVADAVDRIQRSFKESTALEEYFKSGRIELHFIREGSILNENARSIDLILWYNATLGAKSYVMNISDNVKRTNDFRVRQGQWMGRAPIGYLNKRNLETDKAEIVLDPVRSVLVKECFELYATGQYSVRALAKVMRDKGLTNPTSSKLLSKNQIDNLLKNPFYHGQMLVKKELFPHKYSPIITEALFLHCKQVRDGYNKKPFKFAAKPFVLRGLIRCGHCGCSISFDQKKGKYTYGCCTKYKGNCGAQRVKEDDLLDQIGLLFKKIKVPESVALDIQEKLNSSHEVKKNYHLESLKALDSEYELIQSKLDVLLDVRISMSITQSEYDKKATDLKQRQFEIDILRKQHTNADKDFAITVTHLLNLSSRAYELFQSSKVEQKRALISFVLSNLSLHGKKVLADWNNPFEALVTCAETNEWLPLLDMLRTQYLSKIFEIKEGLKILETSTLTSLY